MIPAEETVAYLSLQAFQQQSAGIPLRLIDVRPPEAFMEGHIPGARNYCVYEVGFLEQVKQAVGDEEAWIVLYGESSAYKAAEVAYLRLVESGYKRVQVLAGGLGKWISEGETVDASTVGKSNKLPVGKLYLDADQSAVRWTGRNLTNQHSGRIAIKSGWIEIDVNGSLMGGELRVDMRLISCEDILDPKLNQVLIAHLKNIDFFEVERYPEAGFRLADTAPISENTYGQPNLQVSGEMTIRGVSRALNCRAMLNPVEDGVAFQTQVDVNRVRFGAVYGSGSLFERLGMHLVNDLVSIDVTAVFK